MTNTKKTSRFYLSALVLATLLFGSCSENKDGSDTDEGKLSLKVNVTGNAQSAYTHDLFLFSKEAPASIAIQSVASAPDLQPFSVTAGNYTVTGVAISNRSNITYSQAPAAGASTLADRIAVKDMSKDIPDIQIGSSLAVQVDKNENTALKLKRSVCKATFDISTTPGVTAVSATLKGLYDYVGLNGEYGFQNGKAASKTVVLDKTTAGFGKSGVVVMPADAALDLLEIVFDVTTTSGTHQIITTFENGLNVANEQLVLKSIITESTNESSVELNISYAAWNEKITIGDDVIVPESAFAITIPDFSAAYIYTVKQGDKIIGELYKELLTGENEAQVIVFYPADKNGVIDMTNGFVASNGGSVVWSDGVPTYLPKEESGSVFYLQRGKCSFTAVADAVDATIEPKLLVDVRGDETIKYKIVKIGTQIWMAENLNTVKYTDGNNIPVTDDWGNTSGPLVAAYNNLTSPATDEFRSTRGLMYNPDAAMSEGVAPTGWRVSLMSDWDKLQAYLKTSSAPKTKATWGWNEGGQPASNLSGLSLTALGYGPSFTGLGDNVYIWAPTGDNKYTYIFYSNTAGEGYDFAKAEWAVNGAYPLRCVKK